MLLEVLNFGKLFLDQLYATTWLEWVGTITGFLCVYLAAKEHVLNWPVSIISVVAYAVLFYQYKLFGDALLQVYFLWTAIYGWYFWLKKKEDNEPVVSLNKKETAAVLLAIPLLSLLLGYYLDHNTSTDVPYMDGVCTAMSFIAQLLMTRKVLQNWILWIIVDILYVPLYLYKHLALTSILYLLFLWPAIMGYLDWKKTWRESRL